MAGFWRHCAGAIVAAQAFFASWSVAPALAQDLYDQPVLAVDPGMHTARIWSLAVDAAGRYAVTGGGDRTVRIWSTTDGTLLRTIFMPVGPDPVGEVYAVAISPDGSIVAVGGWTERMAGGGPIYLFDRETGLLKQRIELEGSEVPHFLTFSVDGRYLAATLGRSRGVRVFDRDKLWAEAFRDLYEGESYGASFAPDGRLATTSQASDGTIRLYDSGFRLLGHPVQAPSGVYPRRLAFSPDGLLLAVGYADIPAVDLLDGKSLIRLPGPRPVTPTLWPNGLEQVAWSPDGRTLFAAGTADMEPNVLLAWDEAGQGKERRLPFCGTVTATGLSVLPNGRILVASMEPCLGLVSPEGQPIWNVLSPVADFHRQSDGLQISADAKVVDFRFGGVADRPLRFDTRSLTLTTGAPDDGLTFASNRQGLSIDGWRNGSNPTLRGDAIPIEQHDVSRSVAIAQDGKRFFLGSSFGLTAFDDNGKVKWRRNTRGEVWAVNASNDGRLVVAATGDGAIRWFRADDGRELLALEAVGSGTDWVLWTPEGFYEATPDARDVLKWVVNHGANTAPAAVSVSVVARLHRPDALPLVLSELETARSLGIADVAKARLSVQAATGSEKPPGAVLHVLAIGVDQFGDKADGLHLNYAVDDAQDVANALLTSQKTAPGKATLYADVKPVFLRDDQAGRTDILEALDAMARTMHKSDLARMSQSSCFRVTAKSSKGDFISFPTELTCRRPRTWRRVRFRRTTSRGK